jgi:hypothetical protein
MDAQHVKKQVVLRQEKTNERVDNLLVCMYLMRFKH